MEHIIFVHSASEQTEHTGSNPLLSTIQAEDYIWHKKSYPRDKGQVYELWVKPLIDSFNEIDDNEPITLIGHSFGGTVIMKYLTENQVTQPIKQVILIGSPFFGCDEKYNDSDNKLREDAYQFIDVPVTHIQSKDDDRVDIRHQSCWKNAIPDIHLITKENGKHEFHKGIKELNNLLDKSNHS